MTEHAIPDAGSDRRILIADDDAVTRHLLHSTLTRMGYEVDAFGNGDDAWVALQQPTAPRMAILDWMMPGMNGVDICRRLRERKDVTYTYLVLLTSMDTLSDVVAGLDAGADDYITKPFKLAEVTARLRSGRRILHLQHELLETQATLSVLASRDPLTQLWNRRVIMERLDEEFVRARRAMSPLAVVLADIDHFKHVNDGHGHPVGDQALRHVAQTLTDGLRPYDGVGRFGGEEFLIVVPDCSREEVSDLTERLRLAIAATPLRSERGPIAVTASFGVSLMAAGEAADSIALLDAADRALYRAKAEGRNRVCVAPPTTQDSVPANRHTPTIRS